MTALVETFEYAHAQIAELSGAGYDTVARASGSILISTLYARAGFAAVRGRHRIPLLVSELGLLEAAVINLESYEGNEAALCTGYGLLDDLVNRKSSSGILCCIHGILAFTDEADGAEDPAQGIVV
ncbi:hypothetical protein [Streptomyces sp. NPDC059828]|uniref:hypothetical protein n=1 Tax=Streptomyces sp. NPDC059828 TaxID=3346965 RepID=UPI003666A864